MTDPATLASQLADAERRLATATALLNDTPPMVVAGASSHWRNWWDRVVAFLHPPATAAPREQGQEGKYAAHDNAGPPYHVAESCNQRGCPWHGERNAPPPAADVPRETGLCRCEHSSRAHGTGGWCTVPLGRGLVCTCTSFQPRDRSAPAPSSPPEASALERVSAIHKGIYGGNSDPNRCVCAEKETGRYADTPHVHYRKPPFACARCECKAYEPALPSPAVQGEAMALTDERRKQLAEHGMRLLCPQWADGVHLFDNRPVDAKRCACGYTVERLAALPGEPR